MMRKKIIKVFQKFSIFLIVLGMVFSNIPFNALSGAIEGYAKTANIVDHAWHLSQDDNVVDKFTSYRNLAEKIRLHKVYAAVGDARIEYGQSTNAAPWTSFYTASSNSWGTGATTGIAGTANVGWTVAKESPTEDVTVLATQSSTGKLDIFCRTGSTWTKDIANVTVGTTAATRRFDVEFENTSGIPMVLYSTNTATTNELSYYRKTGAGCGAGSWTGPTVLNPTRVTGIVLWVEMEARKTAGSNVLATAFSDASTTIAQGGILESMIWNAGAWGNESPATAANGWSDSSIELQGTAGANAAKVFDLAFETNTGDLLVAWGTSLGSATVNGWRYATCSATLPCTWSGVLTPSGPLDDATNVACAPDPGSDAIACMAQGNAGNDLTAWLWSGTAVGATTAATADATLLAAAAGDMHVDIDWVVNGTQRMAVGVYAETTTGVRYIYYDTIGAAWRTNTTTSFTPTGAPATALQSVQVLRNPSNPAQLLTVLTDANSDLFSLRLNYNGAAGGATTALSTWNVSTGGNPLELTVSSITSQPFWFDWAKVAGASGLAISQTAGSKVTTKGSGAVNEYAHDIACTGAANCAAFTLAASGGTVNVTSIKVTESGTVTANNELSDVNLYYDFDGNWSDAGAETLFGTAATLAADQTATIAGTLAINTGQTAYIYVRYDLANGATYPMGGATTNWQIATAGDVVSDGTESGSGTLAGTQTVLPVADSVTYVVGGDGGRSGDTATISGKGFGAPSLDADQQDCVTATVGSKGCTRFIVGGNDTVEGIDISTWNNTTITFTVSAAGLSATYGGASALEVVAAGQSTATDLTYYIYPNVTGTVTDFTVSDAAREYAVGDSAANNNTADLKDGEIQINGDHFGASAGTVTILGQSATPGVVGTRCSSSSWTATCITAQVPATIGDGAGGAGDYTGNIVVTRTGVINDSYPGFRILPRITLLTPNSGPNGQSTTIDGNHLCQSSGVCQTAATFNTTADDGNDVEWGTTDATVTGTPSNTQIIANAPVLADAGYPVTVTTGDGTPYTSNELTFTIANNTPPTLSISAPPAGNTPVAEGSSYNVTYTLSDPDNIVTAAFYYDTNNDGVGGTAITGACASAAEGTGATCAFNTSVLTPGTPYYVYGVTNDGVNPAVTTVSSGTITVNDAPVLSVSQPPAGNTPVAEGSSYNVTYTLGDTDNVVTAAFYYDTNNDGVGGTAISGCGAKAEGTGATCAFNTSVLTPGTPYYVYGVTNDGVNPAVTTVSSGTITVNDAPVLSVSQPDGVGDTVNVGDLFNITYTLGDTDNIVTSAFYWDTNNDGVGGTAITGACASAAEGTGATCSWDTTGMTAGSYYVYGVTSGDSVNAAVTAVSPGQITINELAQVTADSSGTQAVNLDSGTTGQYAGAAFRFRQNSGTADTITALTLSEKNVSFTATTGLTSAMIRYETNMVSCTASPITTTGTLAKSGVSFNASDQAVFNTLTSNIPVTVGANYTCVYLFFNIDSSASGGKQIEMELTASGDFTLQNSTLKAGTYPVVLSGTTTIRPNVTGYTNNTEGTITDGAREGNSITINGAGLSGACDGTNTKVQLGAYTLSCTGATFNNTSITITVDTGLPDTNDGGTGASGLLVTIGGTADDVRQTFYAYPTITGVVDDFADLTDDAREYSAGDNAANNSTADLKDGEIQIDGKHFGSSGSVTIHGVTATQAIVGTRCSSTAYTATCITVQVPIGISDSSYVGSIVVERTAGINNTYSGFRVLPRVTSLAPGANGVVGDNLTVNGNHLCQTGTCPGSPFNASNNVLFGATNADAPGTWSWAHAAVNAKVPSGSGTVAVKVVSNDYDSNTTNFTYVSTAPIAPTALQQFKSNGVTEIVVGAGTNDSPTQAKLEGDFTADTSITAFLEVEVKLKNVAFDGTGIVASTPQTGTTFSNMVVSISGLSDGEYHWRARAKNQNTAETSAWVAFGSNPSGDGSTDGSPANVDFYIDNTAPVISGICIVSPTSGSCDGTSQTDIQAQIRWATDENASRQISYQTGSCGTGADAAAVFNSMTNKEPSSPTGSATAHNAILSGLSPVTTYYYKIRAADTLGTVSYSPAGTTCDSFQTDPAQTRVMKTLEFFIDQNTAIGGTLNKAFDVFISESKQDRSNIYIKSVSVDIFGVSVGDGAGDISVAATLNGGGSQTYTLSDPGNGVASSWRTTYATSSLSFDCAYCTTHPSNTLNVSVTGPTNTSLLGAKASVTYYYEPL